VVTTARRIGSWLAPLPDASSPEDDGCAALADAEPAGAALLPAPDPPQAESTQQSTTTRANNESFLFLIWNLLF